MKPEKPILIPEQQVQSLYRFANRLEDVNWHARYKPNNLIQLILPHLLDFTTESIRKVTSSEKDLKAVIGLSGGLDSCTAATLVAESMRKAKQLEETTNTSLVLLSFLGMSEEDLNYARQFAINLGTKYSDLGINYVEMDLTSLLKEVDQTADTLVKSSRRPKIYSGELATRFMDTLIMEYADRTGHCAVDPTNGSEYVLGELVVGTGFEYSPISDFYKSQIYDLAEALGVTPAIINRPPVNSAFGTDKIASYFGEIPEGFTPREVFAILDPVLHLIYDRRFGPQRIAKELGHSLEFNANVYRRIRDQDNRRIIPYFTLLNRYMKFPRTVQDIPNQELKDAFEAGFSNL